MLKNKVVRNVVASVGTEVLVGASPILAASKQARSTTINLVNFYLNHVRQPANRFQDLPGVQQDMAKFGLSIQNTADRMLSHRLAKPVIRSAARIFVNGIMVEPSDINPSEKFKANYGVNPPGFMVLSPGKACNLHCTGCYANAGENTESMKWSTFDRIITEAKELWGVRFIVISGGEPLAYRSEGKDLLDAIERHPDIYFMMYTNGTLINEKTAQRMARMGNLSPAISVEGWRRRTDERRGEGVYNQVLAAMATLKKAGVPFGISLTATRHNVEEIFSDEFLDFFFEEQGALYGWLFHYMPIGRSYTLDLMPNPEQRAWMWKRIWEVIEKRHLFLADFWNHGTLSEGCLAAGRSNGGGYFYIDWNGAISPCVFVPFSPLNINDVYLKGGNLNSIWSDPFFSGIRNWQGNYRKTQGNWLSPCIIRDHHSEFRELVRKHEPDPVDENAEAALLDKEYAKGLAKYDLAYSRLVDPIWSKRYRRQPGSDDQIDFS